MRKMTWLLVVAMLVSMMSVMPASAETTYTQAPLFDERVNSGELPPVEDRLPEVPRIAHEILEEYLDYENGYFGGTLRLVTQVVNWDADGFVGMNEALLTMASANSDDITPNIVEEYIVNEDQTEFTFKIRKGLKWSDGTEVTMEDYKFCIEDVIFNEELTPVVAAYMRDGGVASGDPFTFEEVDENTFKLVFKEAYGGFAVHISIAGWKGYTDLLKPAHFLKKFHKSYAEEIHGSEEAYFEFLKPYAAAMGYDDAAAEDVWALVFGQIDMTNWECTDPTDFLTSVNFASAGQTENFPVLYPWVMKSNSGGIVSYERNPYYFKVDGAGQQLPYIDYLTSTLVEDMEMVQLKYMTGEADFGRESATIDNITLYKENETEANITAYVTQMHNNPTDIIINTNYGLNADGTVKDDDISKAWQEVAPDIRFRQALAMAIDAEEILETVYKGFGEVNELYGCVNDIEGANALLDEMGMLDINDDGYRETPFGRPFKWQIWNCADANDIIPVCELLVEFWTDLGLHVEVYTTETTLQTSANEANEVPMRVIWLHTSQLWHYLDWGLWGNRLWNTWCDKGGLSGQLEEGDIRYLEPGEDYKAYRLKIQSLMTVDPETAVNEIIPELVEWNVENLYIIEPLINVQQCVIVNSGIGNVPTGGIGIGWDFSMEQLFYR